MESQSLMEPSQSHAYALWKHNQRTSIKETSVNGTSKDPKSTIVRK